MPENEEQPETPLAESVKPEQPEETIEQLEEQPGEQSEEPIGEPMTAEELKETVDKMLSNFTKPQYLQNTPSTENAKPEEKESKPRLMKLDSIED